MADGLRTKLDTALEEERARILEELHRSQERSRLLFDTAFAGIGITDADETFTLANTALEEILGFGPDELLGVSLSSVTSGEEFDRYRAFTKKRRQGERDFYETTVYRRDGERRHVLISAAPLTDGNGDFIGTMAVVVDITEQRLTEQSLEESQRRYTEEAGGDSTAAHVRPRTSAGAACADREDGGHGQACRRCRPRDQQSRRRTPHEAEVPPFHRRSGRALSAAPQTGRRAGSTSTTWSVRRSSWHGAGRPAGPPSPGNRVWTCQPSMSTPTKSSRCSST